MALRSKWAAGSDRLEKQPTELWRRHHYRRDLDEYVSSRRNSENPPGNVIVSLSSLIPRKAGTGIEPVDSPGKGVLKAIKGIHAPDRNAG